MATYYNPKTITDNIEFSVDAANVKSWSGTSLGPAGTPYGYNACGSPSRGAPNPYTQIERIDYTNDTATALLKGNVIEPRQTASSATANNTHGYVAGGQHPQTSAINRTDFANDTATAVAKGPLTITRRGHGGVGNNSYGYFGGGNDGSTYVSSIDRVDFSNDSATALARGPLSSTQRAMGATGNASYGYWGGGYNPPALSTMSRLDYSSDTDTAVAKGPLSAAKYNLSATGNGDYGYWGGGSIWTTGNTIVHRLDYSSDTTACVVKGPLAVSTNKHSATGDTSYGYFMGGNTNPDGDFSIVQRIDYSNDTATASPKGPLSAATRYASGFSSQANSLGVAAQSNWKDMTGKGTIGTVSGATYNSGNGGYFDFDGTNDTVTFPTSSIVLAEEDFTLGFWVFADDASDNWQCIISSTDTTGGSGNNSAGSWQVGPVSSQIRFYVRNDAGSDHFLLQSSSTISDDTWYNIVITRSSGGSYAMYFNGELEATGSDGDGGTDLDCGIVALGVNRAYDNYWEGGIASVQIYKGKALTAAEVRQNFNATRTRFGV